MSEGTLRVLAYLDHILLAIRRIDRYTKGMTEREFSGNEMAQDAVIRNIEIIGEAARNVARHHPGFAASHPEIPWEDVYLMRNRVAHGYHGFMGAARLWSNDRYPCGDPAMRGISSRYTSRAS